MWNTTDDLLQERLDAHGLALTQMGYPLEYVAEVVTPGVDLAGYGDDSLGEPVPQATLSEDQLQALRRDLQATPVPRPPMGR